MCSVTSIGPVYLWLYSPCGPWPLFQFIDLYTVGKTPWAGDQPVARPLPTHRTTQTQNKRTQTSMPRVGFEPTIPVFQRAKMVHASDQSTSCKLNATDPPSHIWFFTEPLSCHTRKSYPT
jgi:hypothetical protein